MARTTNKARRNDKGSRISVPLSSGYTAIIRRPSIGVITAVQKKAEELFPYPDPPTEQMEMVTGAEVTFTTVKMSRLHEIKGAGGQGQLEAIDALSDTERDLLRQIMVADSERMQYLMDFVFTRRLDIEGAYGDEGRAELIEAFAEELEEVREFGTLPDDLKDLDDWQVVLRCFIVADQMDYASIMAGAMMAFDQSDITPEEVRGRMQFLRS